MVRTADITRQVWGYAEDDSALLKTHISHIRHKLGLPRTGYGSISAVRGIGYRLLE